MSIATKILYIQSAIDEKFRLILDTQWNSKKSNYRQDIRGFLSNTFSSHFSREQLARLNDLAWLPEACDGFISISHCAFLGGFVFSKFKNGFDVEEIKRISIDILKRVSGEAELQECPSPEFLWVAKEAGFKALSQTHTNLIISDLTCCEWQSCFENQIFSFRLKSEKTLDFGLNRGFIFSDGPCLFGFFFK